jgi:hypothetical protein
MEPKIKYCIDKLRDNFENLCAACHATVKWGRVEILVVLVRDKPDLHNSPGEGGEEVSQLVLLLATETGGIFDII